MIRAMETDDIIARLDRLERDVARILAALNAIPGALATRGEPRGGDPVEFRLKIVESAIAYMASGGSPWNAAARAGVSRATLDRWVDRYRREGIDGLRPRKSTGRPRRASPTAD